MLYYIKAKVAFKVRGISGPFNVASGYLVNANTPAEAFQKFEAKVKADHAHMAFESAKFEYTDVAGEIK